MALTDYEEGRILKFVFGGHAFTVPPIYYVAVSSTPMNESGSGFTEPSGGNYSRVAIPNNTTNFVYSANQITNAGTPIIFPVPSAAWGELNYVGFFDMSTGGTPNMSGSLTPSQTIGANEELRFSASGCVITLD